MKNERVSGPRRLLVVALAIAVAALALAWLPALASAAPVGPTLTTAQLQAMLDANGGAPIAGYFKTVLKGATIETIPVRILSITTQGNPDLYGVPPKLIMFEASGAEIDAIGGIASGMSGSPVFVTDGGGDKLVGAVSYGDIFTTHDVGLATPIEYMSAIEDTNQRRQRGPHAALAREGGRDRGLKIVLTRDLNAAKSAAGTAGAAVFAPLAAVQISGIPTGEQAVQGVGEAPRRSWRLARLPGARWRLRRVLRDTAGRRRVGRGPREPRRPVVRRRGHGDIRDVEHGRRVRAPAVLGGTVRPRAHERLGRRRLAEHVLAVQAHLADEGARHAHTGPPRGHRGDARRRPRGSGQSRSTRP